MITLREVFKSEDFALTAKLSMARGQNAHDLVNEAKLLANSVDAIQIPDSAFARPHISAIAAAALLIKDGIDPIVHMNCRDRNRIAIQSDLLGAEALGVSNVLLMRGNSLPSDHLPRTSNVFDLSAIDFIRTAAAIRDDEALAGGKLPGREKLHIGAVATAFRPVETWEPEKLLAKADAGAQFIQLQICMNMDAMREYAAKLIAAKLTWQLQFLGNLAVFPSAESVLKLKQYRPDAAIPKNLMRRLEQASDAEQEGVRICAEQLVELTAIPGIAGANLMTPGNPELITAAIDAARIRSGAQDG